MDMHFLKFLLGRIPSSGISGFYDKYMFNLKKKTLGRNNVGVVTSSDFFKTKILLGYFLNNLVISFYISTSNVLGF